MASLDPRPTLAAPDDDPYLWLEDVDGAAALAWVERQNAATLSRFGDARFAADRDLLRDILDRPDNIPYVVRRGARLFNFWKDAGQPRGVWRTTSLDSFRTATPAWDVVLDIDALAEAEGEDWVWSGASTQPGAHDRAILRLSRGGGDAVVLREFDLTTRSFVADGFTLPEAKGSTDWLDADTLLLSSALGSGMATRAGYARTVRLWRRDTDPRAAPVIFETRDDFMSASGAVDDHAAGTAGSCSSRIPASTTRSSGSATLQGPSGGSICRPNAWVRWHADWLVVKPRNNWMIAGENYAPDTVLGMSLAAFLAGERGFVRLFEPGARRALQGFFWCGGKLVLSILDDLRPVFEILTPAAGKLDGGDWPRTRIAGLPEIGVAQVWSLDERVEESTGDLLANTQDPLTPSSLFLLRPGAAPDLLKRAPRTFDAGGLAVTRHEAVSSDGMRIPYVQVGPPDPTGEAPVHLYGYGGFAISTLASYGSALGKLWLERGGTGVVANLRGGGEFRHALARGRPARGQAPVARRFRRGRGRSGAPRRDPPRPHRRRGRLERRHPDHQHADAVSRPLRRAVLHHPADRHAALFEAARRGQLDRRVRRPRQARGLAFPGPDVGLSRRGARPALPADPDRDQPARRSRPSRPCPQDGREAAGARLRRTALRAGRGRPRLWQGQ